MPSGWLACGAAAPGGELAGQAQQLFQVGEQFAGHLDAVREELAEQLGQKFPTGDQVFSDVPQFAVRGLGRGGSAARAFPE